MATETELIEELLAVDEARAENKQEPEHEQDFEVVEPPETPHYEIVLNLVNGDAKTSKTVQGTANIIMRNNHFAQDKANNLYVYKDGIYISQAEQSIKLAVKEIDDFYGNNFKSLKAKEVIEYIKCSPKRLLEAPDIDILNCRNGLLYFFNGTPIDFNPNWDERYRTTVQINAKYDKKAICPTWDKLVADTFPAGSEELAWEIIAWLMFPLTSIKKSILFYGHGNDGKSIFLKGIHTFLGDDNVSSISLHNLSSRFQSTGLLGKLANIDTDLSAKDLADSSMIKRITGGDTIRVEQKYGMAFDYKPFVRCVFSCNTIPRSQDKSKALASRFIIIPFLNNFKENPALKSQIERQLASEEELSGVLNKAIAAWPRVLSNAFASTLKFDLTSKEILKSNDPLGAWLEEYTIDSLEGSVNATDLHNAYMKAEPKDFERKSAIGFTKAMKELKPEVEKKQVREGSKRPYHFCGIKLLEEEVTLEEGEEDTTAWQ